MKEKLRCVKFLQLTERDKIVFWRSLLKIQGLRNVFGDWQGQSMLRRQTERKLTLLVTLLKSHLLCDTFQTLRQSKLLSPQSSYVPMCFSLPLLQYSASSLTNS